MLGLVAGLPSMKRPKPQARPRKATRQTERIVAYGVSNVVCSARLITAGTPAEGCGGLR
jgi:hypothetical protein